MYLFWLPGNINGSYGYLKPAVGDQVTIKGRVYCISMQVVMNKCFLLNRKKLSAVLSCHFRKKRYFNSFK